MSDLDEITARLDRLEHEMLTLREDAATTRVMAVSAVLKTLREAQVEQGLMLAEILRRLPEPR